MLPLVLVSNVLNLYFRRYVKVKNKSMLLKCFICGSLYLIFNLLIIYTQYILEFSLYSALVLGIFCGISIALVSYCDTAKRTIIAMLAGILSAIATDFISSILGIPYKILMYIFRNDDAIREIGHLTVNELIGYNRGCLLFFWPGLLITFIILIILIPILIRVKNRIV